ncbi:MAG: MmgE/PrpD family protein [Holophaga sp.]|nr:MmgE/PrpD family protein [Holophaga sp.]
MIDRQNQARAGRGMLRGVALFGALAMAGQLVPAPLAAAAAPAPAPRPLADRMAAYAAGLRYADLDPATVETAKVQIIDALGCAIAAFHEGPVATTRTLAVPGGASTILGTAQRTAPDLAGFINGIALRYYDMNDVYVGKRSGEAGHPSDNIAPCLAVAEAERASGKDLITAVVLAYEIDCQMLDTADLNTHGWDHPVCSLPAVALATGKLMRLSPDRLTQAVNLSLNDHIPMLQTRMQVMSDWKGIADAEAGRNGVFAARLARAGITGPAPIFEGTAGFFKQVSSLPGIDPERFGRPGVPFRITFCGMKAYPAQIYSMTAIPAGIAVAHEAGSLDRIKSLEIATTRRGLLTAGLDPEKWLPETKETADHSLPYITARAMLDGEISNDSYLPEKLREPRVRALMQKITVKEDPALTALMPKAVPNRITAVLTDGRVITRQVNDLPGFVGRPMGRADVERKFRGNVGKSWSEAQTRAALDALWQLERQDDLAGLLGKFAIAK